MALPLRGPHGRGFIVLYGILRESHLLHQNF